MNKDFIYASRLKRRYLFEYVFKFMGIVAIFISCSMLLLMLSSIIWKGYSALMKTEIKLTVELPASLLQTKQYDDVIKLALQQVVPSITDEQTYEIISETSQYQILKLANQPELVARPLEIWLPASSKVDMYIKGKGNLPIELEKLVAKLAKASRVRKVFNSGFFLNGDSRDPENAGMKASIMGSLLTMMVCMVLAFPFSVATAIYLEEFAPKNKLTYFIELNINNLAAVPSIVFGLLSLAVFIGVLGVPRSSSLAGGMTLALMVMPSMIVTARNAIKSVPSSIKDAVMALGASELQILIHHTLPLAIPGILTGTILAVSRAIGETAPLIMIGMVAFIAEMPSSIFDPSPVVPVQIYLWADSPELGFTEKTAAAIMVLLIILVIMNLISVILRKKYEIRW